jgi:surface antigen
MQRVTAVVFATVVVANFAWPVYADQFDDQISGLQQQIAQQKAQLNALSTQADTLANKLSEINAQVAAINSQLNLTTTQLDQVNEHIAQLNAQMVQKKDYLKANIKTIYLQSSTTPIEILLSSDNISDYFNKQEYLDKVKNNIQSALADLQATKKELDGQQAQLTGLQGTQRAQQQEAATQQAQQRQLLAETQGQESAYQSLVAQNNQKLQGVIAARAAAIQSGDLKVSGGGCGSYPDNWCHAAQDSVNTIYGYPNRECTSYAAYRRQQLGKPLGGNWGNAGSWYANVNSSTPHVGDVMVWPYGHPYAAEFGHVAVVEGVTGSSVTFSQYNFNFGSGWGLYSSMTATMGSAVISGVGYIR